MALPLAQRVHRHHPHQPHSSVQLHQLRALGLKAATRPHLLTPRAAKAQEERPWDTGPSSVAAQRLEPFHLVTFFILLSAGLMFLAVLLFFTADIKFQGACLKVFKRLLKTVALRQLMGILAAMMFVRFAMEPIIKAIRSVFRAPTAWERSTEFYVLREMYRPLELLFTIAAISTLAENFLPQLIALPKGMIQNFVRSTLSLTFVIAAAKVVFSIKGRMTRESSWQLELKGDLTRQRRVEAVDKLLSVLTLLVASVFGLQAIGLDVNSVLAIGGVGGLAVGLAGREILENLFTGLIILSSSPFEVGEEVVFTPPSGGGVEGIVLDVGWYRTTIRSFEREIFNIPNSVFSRNVVLNVTRKQREWRFFEFIGLRVEDISRVGPVVSDMRRIIRQDPRIIQKLHRRVFLDKITREQISVYISCYVEAANRDAFMAVKQDLLLAFVDTVARNGARLAVQRLQIDVNGARAAGGLPAGRPAAGTSSSAPPPGKDGGGGGGNAAAGALPSAAAAAQSLQDNNYPQGPNPPSSTNGERSSSRKRENSNGDRGSDRDIASPSSTAVILAEEIRSNSQQLGNLITASFEEL
ncbi:hypothetical protein WJX84_010012 [Apatococcus fuscideae]|uniref:Uncharacterized protein n=1 Tax=Apatococcus fuscideae TaxID=2026836 RepID=A0AAW1T2V2_9CHLO